MSAVRLGIATARRLVSPDRSRATDSAGHDDAGRRDRPRDRGFKSDDASYVYQVASTRPAADSVRFLQMTDTSATRSSTA